MDYLQLFTTLLAAIAAIISFQSFRLSGKKRVAEMRHAWLSDLRDKVASVYSETNKWESGNLDIVKLSYLMEYIDLMLDISVQHHKDLKNALFPVALNAESRNAERLRVAYDQLGVASRSFFLIERKAIEKEVGRWL